MNSMFPYFIRSGQDIKTSGHQDGQDIFYSQYFLRSKNENRVATVRYLWLRSFRVAIGKLGLLWLTEKKFAVPTYTFFPIKNTVSMFSTACASSLFQKVMKPNLRDFSSNINFASVICPYLAKHCQRSSTVA